ncbi:hypothetical protein HUA74_06865 [Myxococcus sp. CA051A]|uniref:hypothetical protein n=1 Tax=Myxococcus sp. CA051A TaxID=2741739 RepID=UPI00157B3913|nr:hypothetical protein [Myxococcus sp. CA051A]NTX60377.1 hypothetical protein [Myxococcus sp. CA051A]
MAASGATHLIGYAWSIAHLEGPPWLFFVQAVNARTPSTLAIGLKIRFGRWDERLLLSYNDRLQATPCIEGTLIAIRRVREFI